MLAKTAREEAARIHGELFRKEKEKGPGELRRVPCRST